jgi:hypothetical protein
MRKFLFVLQRHLWFIDSFVVDKETFYRIKIKDSITFPYLKRIAPVRYLIDSPSTTPFTLVSRHDIFGFLNPITGSWYSAMLGNSMAKTSINFTGLSMNILKIISNTPIIFYLIFGL